MKALIVYYSRTGKTRGVAEKLAGKLNADITEIVDLKSRKGPLGFVGGAHDALKKLTTEISPISYLPENYDIVIVGTPVWADNMTPAVRTFLAKYPLRGKRAAFFCTTAVSGIDNTLATMAELAMPPTVAANLGLTQRDLKNAALLEERISNFLKGLPR
ncbi:MAG: flavodoxin [Candidatus Omnitrophica bacterium]|nr:flavodoxin [Candidatus Omnitrophota bacterium]